MGDELAMKDILRANNALTRYEKKENEEGGLETKVIDMLKTKDKNQIVKAMEFIEEHILDPNAFKSKSGLYNGPGFEKIIDKFFQDINRGYKIGEIECGLGDGATRVKIKYSGNEDMWEIRISGYDGFQSDAVKKWKALKD